jgi:hypothetical protein
MMLVRLEFGISEHLRLYKLNALYQLILGD